MINLNDYEVVEGNCGDCWLNNRHSCECIYYWVTNGQFCVCDGGIGILKKKERWVTCTRGNTKVGDTVRARTTDRIQCEVKYSHITRPWFILTYFNDECQLKEGEYPMDDYEIQIKD